MNKMQEYARDLTHVGIYFVTLAALIGGIAWGASAAVETLAANPALQTISELLEPDKDEEQSKISHMIESSREIRDALARPVTGPAPLPAITASVEHGNLIARASHHSHARRTPKKIPREALDAMAQGPQTTNPVQVNPQFNLHRIY